jgi:ribA/ribD-fused uncharacterized protein
VAELVDAHDSKSCFARSESSILSFGTNMDPNEGTKPNRIESFSAENRFLSNFWPVEVQFEDIAYPSVEQAYKAAKTTDVATRLEISRLKPNKRDLGEKIEALLSKHEIRTDWSDDIRLEIMENLLIQKFDGRDEGLRQKLIDTGDVELIEGNTWGDTFFGICDGVGENHLGKLLMKVRESLK